ncbi:MAG TPA: hypothetical protein VER68_08955 [Azonexus sp.]|nr:hypothetical protein [Azonexus sp.]
MSFRRKPESRRSKALDTGFRRCDELISVDLSFVLVAQLAPQDLADGRFRQAIAEVDMVRPLVVISRPYGAI